MTLRHLKILVAVCQTGSTTKAGEKLYIAQPSISLAISEIESYYGIRLFDRISKRLHITESGKLFLQYANQIVDLFDSMEQKVKNFDTMGVLRVGTSITIGNYLLPNYVKEFKETHPDMDVKVIIDNSDKIQQYVLSNQIDIGLIEGIVHSETLIKQNFRDDELILICAKDHHFAGKKGIKIPLLQSECLLLREMGSAGRELFDSTMMTHGLEFAPSWESTSTQAILRAVQANLGISVLPYLLVKDGLDRNEICQFELDDIQFKRKFCIIYHKNKFLAQSAKDFIGLCH